MMNKGIDVSHWQGNIDWNKVKKAGIEFAIIKAGGSDAGFYISKKMLDDGLISVAEFNKLTAINRETFSPLFAEIMPEIP